MSKYVDEEVCVGMSNKRIAGVLPSLSDLTNSLHEKIYNLNDLCKYSTSCLFWRKGQYILGYGAHIFTIQVFKIRSSSWKLHFSVLV